MALNYEGFIRYLEAVDQALNATLKAQAALGDTIAGARAENDKTTDEERQLAALDGIRHELEALRYEHSRRSSAKPNRGHVTCA